MNAFLSFLRFKMASPLLTLVLAFLLGAGAMAAPATTPAPQEAKSASISSTAQAKKLQADVVLPGVALAEGVSEITGVAISPLLGMSAIGAWKYYDTAPELRSRLPWYCHPYAWGTGLFVISLCFMKDFFGAAVPALVKKPLDFAELFEDKISALVASTAFVPLVALALSHVESIQLQSLAAGGDASGLAMLPLASVVGSALQTPWVTVPLSVFIFVVVWLSSHALNVLIALSPFGILDATLKLTKLGLLAVVTGSAALIPYSPIPALVVCCIIILIGLLLAGWSFRLMLFGTFMGRDLLLNKRAAAEDVKEGVRSFLARRTSGVPVRTLGKLRKDDAGVVHFTYRPWLVMPEKRVPISAKSFTTTAAKTAAAEVPGLVVCRGLIYSSVAHPGDAQTRMRYALILLPRYRRLEESIAQHYDCQGIHDSTLVRGYKAVRQWLSDMLSSGRSLTNAEAGKSV